MIPRCKDCKIALTPWSPLAGGRLSHPRGVVTPRVKIDQVSSWVWGSTYDLARVVIDNVLAMARARSISMGKMSLRWMLGTSYVTAFISRDDVHPARRRSCRSAGHSSLRWRNSGFEKAVRRTSYARDDVKSHEGAFMTRILTYRHWFSPAVSLSFPCSSGWCVESEQAGQDAGVSRRLDCREGRT